MSKKFHPYIALCLLFLFGFLLAESGLHALIHSDHHAHAHINETSNHHGDCDHSDTDLSLEAADEVCHLCVEFTLHAAYALGSIDSGAADFTGSHVTRLFPSLSENSEAKLNPTRGPPVA